MIGRIAKVIGISIISMIFMAGSANAFTVAPQSLELETTSKSSIDSSILIRNTKTQEQTYYLSTLKFEPKDDTGQPLFIPYEEDHSGLAEWFVFPEKKIVLEAGEEKEVPFSVYVPENTPAGSYYASITVSRAPSEIVTNGATVESKIAVLVFLTVSGDTIEDAEIIDFSLKDQEGLINRPPIDFSVSLQNRGNVHVVPTGSIRIKNLLGTVDEFTVNDDKGRLLPYTTRVYNAVWLPELEGKGSFWEEFSLEWKHFSFGPHTASLNLEYGSGQNLSSEIKFWIFPWRVVLFGLIVSLTILLIGFLAIKNLKKR